MTEVDLTTDCAGMTLANPVMTAAGCAGAGREVAPFLDVADLGAFVTRSVTLESRAGGSMPRFTETPSGMLASTGLPGTAVEGFLATELPWLAQRRVRTVVSLAAGSLADFGELARRVGQGPGVSALEVNLSSTDAPGLGLDAAPDAIRAARIVSVVRREARRGLPLLAKLSPEAVDLVGCAEAAVEAGADALVLGNAPRGLVLDPTSLRPALGGVTGGLGGPATHPLALRRLWDVRRALPGVPLVGAGGVRTGFDALAMLAVGACAVQVGTAVLQDPAAPARILGELADELGVRGYDDVAGVVGCAHQQEGEPS
jgi:dihydroorotate dehydrogenase (NAD+) catalytic subunit